MLAPNEVDAVTALVRRVAVEIVLPRFRRLQAHEIHEKSAGSLVTIADLEAERALTPQLEAMLPGSIVVGEEATANDESLLDRLDLEHPVWIIDPVDGTHNFANADDRFVVMVALVQSGKLSGGSIYNPTRDHMAVATLGGGAWLIEGGQAPRRLKVPEPRPLTQMHGTASGRVPDRGRIADIIRTHGGLGTLAWIRCAGFEYMRLAEGGLDYGIFGRLWPWDHAAGVLMYREAGGIDGFMDSPEPVPYTPRRRVGPLLLAPNRQLWSTIRAQIVGE